MAVKANLDQHQAGGDRRDRKTAEQARTDKGQQGAPPNSMEDICAEQGRCRDGHQQGRAGIRVFEGQPDDDGDPEGNLKDSKPQAGRI